MEKRHILFMLEMYYPKPEPNGIVVHQVAKELIKLGYQVHVISYRIPGYPNEDQYDGVFIHRIKKRMFYKLREYGENNINTIKGKISYKLAKIINKIKKLIYLPWFPLASPTTVIRYYKKASLLHKKYKFDCVIGVFDPNDCLYAGVLFKNRFKDVKYGSYILDSLIYLSGQNYLPKRLKEKLTWKFEKMVYENSDIVFNMECHRRHHLGGKYEPFQTKMKFLDIPLFIPKKVKMDKRLFDTEKRHLVYMGSLFRGFRTPDYIYRIFKSINHKDGYQLHFYTRGSCEEDLLNYQYETGGAVIRHGFVEHSQINNIIANADFLINLGVSNSTAISSKIFDYMSTGKPIIHFYYNDDDVNLSYFEKYELSLMIKMDESLFEVNVDKVRNFLTISYGKTIESDTLLDIFYVNTPMYSASQFDNLTQSI
ncbi:hypothetical protein [Neobacillus citreus]|uniref:Glycosyltransferase subfamily 4-like N-terminal domain-containing protein n=1 Tax=Neobacillus citreus TaxID=2833578 RepID=A0A942T3P8_9BACI|nr:hypothetical protein [Neobacillus citreus]MCH6266008.1 hypothetical protein [Neobacillus citreus]